MTATLNITDMSKNIYRQKRKSNYTIVPNEMLNNKELSWKAKGMLAYLLSLPDTWEVYAAHLRTVSVDGNDSTVSGLNELMQLKYVWRKPRSGTEPGGWEYLVFDEPQLTDPFRDGDSPTREIPDSGKPAANKEREEEVSKQKKEKDGFVANAPETIPDDLFDNLDSVNTETVEPRIANRSAMASRSLQSKDITAEFRNRANRLLGRREATNWSAGELKAAKANLETCEEDWKLLEKYYANRGKEGFYTRRSMLTLLNNWAGEIDKARAHHEEQTENEYKCDDFKL